jgi:uncharacterized membrane protein
MIGIAMGIWSRAASPPIDIETSKGKEAEQTRIIVNLATFAALLVLLLLFVLGPSQWQYQQVIEFLFWNVAVAFLVGLVRTSSIFILR